MRRPDLIVTLLATVGSAFLSALVFTQGLEGAGPFKDLLDVKVGFLVGMVPAYFLVLWLTTWLTGRAAKLSQKPWRIAALWGTGIISITAAFFAPLIPSALLAVSCMTQATCPDAANPVLWSYLQVIIGFPPAPSLVALLMFFIAARAAVSRPSA